jgi:hypothetical protein
MREAGEDIKACNPGESTRNALFAVLMERISPPMRAGRMEIGAATARRCG